VREIQFEWDKWNIAHIAQHDVEPDEVEEIFEHFHIIQKTRQGRRTAYNSPLISFDQTSSSFLFVQTFSFPKRKSLEEKFGYVQTLDGRYLFVVFTFDSLVFLLIKLFF
jgi:hypothetical protein